MAKLLSISKLNNFILFCAVIVTIIFHGCTSERIPIESDECNFPCNVPNITSTAIEVTRGDIYLDLSVSMKGYISDKNENIPFTLLQHLLHSVVKTSFHHVKIAEPSFHGFSRTIVNNVGPMLYYAVESSDKISPRSRYNKSETNIVGLFREISQKTKSVSVVITDGLQDVSGIGGSLASGFDRAEFINAVCENLVEQQFGVWLVGIMNDFDGYYYNIIPNKQGKINQAIRLHKTKRPVYCWIISKDIVKGRELVQYLTQNLKDIAEPYNGNNNELIHTVEISPGIFPNLIITEPTAVVPSDSSVNLFQNFARVRNWYNHPSYCTTKCCRIDYPEAYGKNIQFVIQAKMDFSDNEYTWNSLPESIWRIDIENTGEFPCFKNNDFSEYTIINADKSLRFIGLQFPYDRLAVFDVNSRKIELPVYLYADLQNGLSEHWLTKWNTRNDTNEQLVKNKSLYIYDVVSGVLLNTIGKKSVGGCLHLSFTER